MKEILEEYSRVHRVLITGGRPNMTRLLHLANKWNETASEELHINTSATKAAELLKSVKSVINKIGVGK